MAVRPSSSGAAVSASPCSPHFRAYEPPSRGHGEHPARAQFRLLPGSVRGGLGRFLVHSPDRAATEPGFAVSPLHFLPRAAAPSSATFSPPERQGHDPGLVESYRPGRAAPIDIFFGSGPARPHAARSKLLHVLRNLTIL
ncbi:hypothetical protein NDU88_002551 [Pleurodeles waltl]|uniref:Uncharacterized protein n=1 Tax=Pleurodeles waltl TaxID=8319 RepID=A0AAV7TKZ9_PLEWA|nr:hypothetical protein NDU88_002551 [Pleurodeles waltl]